MQLPRPRLPRGWANWIWPAAAVGVTLFLISASVVDIEPGEAAVRINNITGILQAVEAGLGIGVVPDFVAAQHPNLVPVLPEVPAPGFDVHLVYADALRQSKRVAAFRDFVVKSSKDWQY